MTQSQNNDNPFRPEDAPASSANPAKNIGRRDMLGMAIAAAAALGMASPARALGSTLGMTSAASDTIAPGTRTVTDTIPSGTLPSLTQTFTVTPPGTGTVISHVTITERITTTDFTVTFTRTGVITRIQSGTVVTVTFPSGTVPSQTVTLTIPGPSRKELPGDGQYAGVRLDLRDLRSREVVAGLRIDPLA